MATKPTIASVAVGQKISASLWNGAVYTGNNFWDVTKPVCVCVQNSTQSGIVTATFTAITFDAEVVDTDAQHSTVTNNSRVVIGNTLGWYRCSGVVAWGGTGGTYRAELDLNGTGQNGSQTILATTGTFVTSILNPTLVHATSNSDYVELKGYQASGGNMATAVSGTLRSYFIVEYIGTLS